MGKQIFQTDSKSRWREFKWSIRVIAFILGILIIVFITMLIIDHIPSIPPFHQDYRSVVAASKPFLQENKYSREYKGFRKYIMDRSFHSDYAKEKRAYLRKHHSVSGWDRFPAGIRSAFYVTWDNRSYLSLKRNIRHLNLVLPEWFFINPKTDNIDVKIDTRGLNLMHTGGVPIMPILSNNYNGKFVPDGVGRILHNPAKRKAFINNVLNLCLKNKFIGINLDLEELKENSDEYLTTFVREMATAFHSHGLLITQDIMPFNTDYDVQNLAYYDDYLFLMAYDEYSLDSDPGPISSQRWIEAALDDLARKVPNDKIVLGLAAYGYDWCDDKDQNENLSYADAIGKANGCGSKIIFNNNTYNLNYAFSDYNDLVHQVYFTDAATNFNIMRFGVEYGLAGFGLWRLGSEDNRLWKFYDKDLSENQVNKISKNSLETVPFVNGVNYIGDGEILDPVKNPQRGDIRMEVDSMEMLISEEDYVKIPSPYIIHKYGEAPPRQLLLTFDDGPDARWTPQILKILAQYHIKAAFFMVGLQVEANLPIVKQVYEQGHIIGNHTFTHRNVANNTPQRTAVELELTRLLIECITGHSTILFRPPYNADSEPTTMEEILPIVWARQHNYITVGESIDPEDWEEGIKADEIYNRVIYQVTHSTGHIILLHDAGGITRIETIKALPRIINYLEKHGYTFTTLTSILGKSRAQLMPAIPKGKAYYAMQANLLLATIVFEIGNFLGAMFIIFIILGFGRLLFMVVLTVREKRKDRAITFDTELLKDAPLVSIIVPAFNEEVNAVSSLNNLLHQDYPNYNIIFVDDGSSDNTYNAVCEAFSDNSKIKIFTKPNGGKASALNYGLSRTDAEYVVCIDADTKLLPDAMSWLMMHYLGERGANVGAVAGNVKVGNRVNILTKWQAIEYTTSQNFDRLAYSNINAITVVPGAIGAFKKSAIEAAGGLTTDTLAEDCDLTIRITRAGYRVDNENRAVALTEAPEKVRQFVKQRTRWSFGIMQTFWKNRDALLSKKYKGLGLWAMPNMLIFQFIIPTFSPLADLFMLVGLFSGNAGRIFVYYLLFTLIDASVSIAAFIFEREKLSVLLWIIPQRFCYRWIMYVVLFKSYKRAIKGELQTWGVLKRTGDVKSV